MSDMAPEFRKLHERYHALCLKLGDLHRAKDEIEREIAITMQSIRVVRQTAADVMPAAVKETP